MGSTISTLDEFFSRMQQAWQQKGQPTYRDLGAEAGVSHATANTVIRGPKFPTWQTFSAVTEVLCDGDEALMVELTELWMRTSGRKVDDQQVAVPDRDRKAFFDALHQAWRGAGRPSTRLVAKRAGIGHETVRRALTGRALPHWHTFQPLAFMLAGRNVHLVNTLTDLWIAASNGAPQSAYQDEATVFLVLTPLGLLHSTVIGNRRLALAETSNVQGLLVCLPIEADFRPL